MVHGYILAMWVNWFSNNGFAMYYCVMEMEQINTEKRQLMLEDGSQYFYTINPVEIANVLGAAVAVLNEYFITNSKGENYKLYKTNEGNWYDVPDSNKEVAKGVLLKMKLGIDNEKK